MPDLIHPIHGDISFSYDGRGVLQARNSIGDLVDTADLADSRMNRMILRLRSAGGAFARLGASIRSGLGSILPRVSAGIAALGSRFPRLGAVMSRVSGAFGIMRGRMASIGPLFRAFGAALGPIARGLGSVGRVLGRGISAAASAAGSALGAMGKVLGSLGPVGFAAIAGLGALPGLAAASASAVTALASATAAVSGAAIAALPAAIFAVGGAAIVVKAAFSGLGDAVKAAFETDPAKFNEAIKKLAPNAQAAAGAFRTGVVPVLKSLQQNIQQVAFTGLAPQITSLGEGLRELKGESGGVAAALNVVLSNVLKFGNSTTFLSAANASHSLPGLM